jgi:hypothetical protein
MVAFAATAYCTSPADSQGNVVPMQDRKVG